VEAAGRAEGPAEQVRTVWDQMTSA